MMAPVIAASQCAGLWTELGASYRKFWNIYGKAGSDPGLLQYPTARAELPRNGKALHNAKKHTAPLGNSVP